ncbi:hypothetical protein TrVE_jg14499 [Triparma verrucosa]|uniref:Uncharacterized protein n=2 Tax=Triparma TaxID=722752 RepID=A0A9W7C083_9STRA|nr:hypothetical protein TrVE_jg14499 [Triparma verrucosa]GMH97636.1 hypothetical protein TrST_g10682 [Triparma strigata]
MFASRAAARAVPAFRASAKRFGSGQAEATAEMEKWKKISLYGALPATAFLCVINMGILATSGHHHYADEDYVPGKGGVELPTHVRLRNKPYPWSCPDCNLFHAPCWAKCKAAKAEA